MPSNNYRLIKRLDSIQERISDLEGRSTEITQTKKEKGKKEWGK